MGGSLRFQVRKSLRLVGSWLWIATAACSAGPAEPPTLCANGFEGSDSGACLDIDECAAGTEPCDVNATCTNEPGSFSCTCNAGFEGDGATCADVDECTATPCDVNATCTNEPGSFTCACEGGFDGDGLTCADVDECADETDDCDPNATCTNTVGGFSCTCVEGYDGDGKSCAYVLPTMEVDFVPWIKALVADFPGQWSEEYSVPIQDDLDAFAVAAQALFAGDWPAADGAAAPIGYEVVQITDLNEPAAAIVGLIPQGGNVGHRGWFFVHAAPSDVRPLVIESPHSRYDTRTGVLGADIFRSVGARAFLMNATHRCANNTTSGCSGTTGVCGDSMSYRESDMAHTEAAYFQVFHEQAMLSDAELLAVQIHGFKSNDDDPEFTFSNGTTADTEEAWSNTLAADLALRVAEAGSLKPPNSCNEAGDINKLCATTNTQGRFTNGLAHELVCANSAPEASGRFLHLELSYDLRNPGGTLEPILVIESIAEVFGP